MTHTLKKTASQIIQLTALAKHVLDRKRELGELGKVQLKHDVARARRGNSAWFASLIAGTPFTQSDLADAVEAVHSSPRSHQPERIITRE